MGKNSTISIIAEPQQNIILKEDETMASHVDGNGATEIKVGDCVVMTIQSDRRFTNQQPLEQTGVVTKVKVTKNGTLYTVRSTRSGNLRRCNPDHVKKL